jgi:hypothetical protein
MRLLALLFNNPELVARVPDEEIAGISSELATLRAVTAFFREDPRRNAAMASAYFEGSEHASLIWDALQEPLLKQAESPNFDEEAEVQGIVERLQQGRLGRRKEALFERVEAGVATPAEKAEYMELQARLATARAGNPAAEAGSKF